MNLPYYINDLQKMRDRIDNQIRQYQQNQFQPMAQPITQNFQITPSQNVSDLESKYVENIDEVKNTFVMKTGLFINKDFSTLWIKDVSGNIRTFKLDEVIELDEKDKEISLLKKQIKEMKGVIENAKQYDSTNANEQIADTKSTKLQSNKRGNAK